VTWTRLSPEGVAPVARQGASWTVDPSTGVAYLYGGTTSPTIDRPLKGGATLGDLWAYDLNADTWEPAVGTSDEPPPRSGQTATWVEDLGLIVIGGRGSDGQALGDVWRFDPSAGAWSRLDIRGTPPPARFDACAAAPGDGTLLLTHGTNGRALYGTTWRLDLASLRWREIVRSERPSARSRVSCWVDAGGRFVVYGGDRGGTALGDLWAISAGNADAKWSRLAGGGTFPARSGAASAIHLDQAVIVGGVGSDRSLRADLGVIGPTDKAPSPVPVDGSPPPATAGAALVDDPAGERMLLLGGATADGVSSELWSADLH
jgi:Galactose oxidase, central domain